MSVTISVQADSILTDEEGFDYGEHDINLANANFYDLMCSLNRVTDAHEMCGCWNADEQRQILTEVHILSVSPSSFEKETVVDSRIIDCGRDAEYVKSKLSSLKSLLEYALENNREVYFA
jgi:hypothetical protein